MDFSKLRADALSHGEDEEAVTVNTRALIDKVLARYSGEWTTLRELLQNAADASATTVKIKFETLPSISVPLPSTQNQSEILKHALLHSTLRRLLVTNNGTPFNANDWARLKRIAEGNPDETKIGAFGVGFYSVFADCEDPFVSSGKEAMAFYWKGNSLFTRKIQVPEGTSDTNFVLDYRNNTTPVPSLISLCQFLATSLTFVALQNIELWVDDWKILSLQKKISPSVNITIPRDVETTTKDRLMRVHSLEKESIQMDAAFMNVVGWRPSSSTVVPKSSAFGENSYGSEVPYLRSFFSRLTTSSSQQALKTKAARDEKAMQEIVLEDLTSLTSTNVFLSVTTASIRTSVAASFAAELERATKKPPPKTTKLAILTSSYDEMAASNSQSKNSTVAKGVDVFASVLPSKKPGGRIFIGFPTHQTTGAGFHLSAPSLIPTVERESIDLNARWVRTWNIEMLRVAGIMSRLAYANEMTELGNAVKRNAVTAGRGNKITKDDIAKYMAEAQHIIQSYTFAESTPSVQISQIIEEAFWTTYKKPYIEFYSTQGVLHTTVVRIATEDFSGFVEGIPVVPKDLVDIKFVQKLRDFGLLTEITVGDVKKELGAKALTKAQLIEFIAWVGRKAVTREIEPAIVQDLLDTCIATIGENEGEIVTLATIKHYLQPAKIPPELPIPPNTLSFELTRYSPAAELQALGWQPLDIVTWLRFLVESIGGRNGLTTDQDITWSGKFSAQILGVLSKQWDALDNNSKATVISLLKPLTVIPTKLGMKIPTEAYFSSVKLFDDLPTIQNCPGVKEKFLGALGVRKTVELETIFQRLLNTPTGEKGASKWNHIDLIAYLASVREDIPSEDLTKLKTTPICAAEAGPPGAESSQGTTRRYKFDELFEPKDALRGLGLPIIQWTGKSGYRPGSPEGRFLTYLGLKSYPSVAELVAMMASTDLPRRSKAMNYYISNHQINGYASVSLGSSRAAFMPVEGDEKKLVAPGECFAGEKSRLLGFNVLRRDLAIHANKFGVAENPPITDTVNRLINDPPKTRHDAKIMFGYMSTRLGEIGQGHALKLSDAHIIPVVKKPQQSGLKFPEKQTENIKHVSPRLCFIGDSETYRDIFDFVDFGNDANVFLLHCGSNHEPSRIQVASMLVSEPARVLGIVQSPEKYLELLRLLALSLPELKKQKTLFAQMKSSPFLLATKEIRTKSEKTKPSKSAMEEDDDDERESIKQWVLQPPHRIVIVDDFPTYQLFMENLLCAPLEESLEHFYLALGSSTISSLVEDRVGLGAPIDNPIRDRIQKRILERSKIFLHSYPTESLRHNSKWLDKNLNTQMVSSISLRRSLRGYSVSHNARQTATLNQDQNRRWVLYITKDVDYYHISLALVHHLLMKPNNEAATLFEFLLTQDLQGLKRRGYNVDRILRAQAADARIAEEERQKQLQAEQQQIKEQEEQWRQREAAANAEAVGSSKQKGVKDRTSMESNPPPMPGSFDNDIESSPEVRQRKRGGLFSNLTRRLGIDSSSDAQQQLQNFLTGNTGQHRRDPDTQSLPPSYEDSTRSPGPTEGTRQPNQPEHVTSPAALHQNLVNAIQSSRAHDSSSLFSNPHVNNIKEQATYCDSTPAQDITSVGATSNGMRIFASKGLSIPVENFLRDNGAAMTAFATLLYDVGNIYSLQRTALHIFYNENGSTIAFNSQGSIFCNLRFFLQLHWAKVQGRDAGARAEAASWWWIVLAHELAHNIVAPHNAEHSYYTESFIAQYFMKMMKQATAYHSALPAPPASTSRPREQELSLLD